MKIGDLVHISPDLTMKILESNGSDWVQSGNIII